MTFPHACAACSQRIGERTGHYIVRRRFVICARCYVDPATHSLFYPHCLERWHDMADHGYQAATRAGAHFALRKAAVR